MGIKSFKRVFAIGMLSMAMTAFAEDAPVYDVDNYPPQFDGQPDAGMGAPPPPAPQEQGAPQASPQASRNTPQPVLPVTPQSTQSMPQSLTIDQRISRMEQQMMNLQHSDSASKLSALQTEVQSLRGQVEELTHQLQQLQSQQRSMFSDLDKRLNKQTTTPAPAVETNDTTTPAAKSSLKKTSASKKPKVILTPAPMPLADEPPADDQPVSPKPVATDKSDTATVAKTDTSPNAEQEELQMYQNAYDLIKDSKFDQAITVLQNMLKKYPSGQSAANAHYWLGELYGLQKKRDQAAAEFANVVKNYPDSPKVSDAEVKLGMIYASQFKWPEAKTTFKRVITRYPGTTSARLAAQQLKEIKSGGH
jgi:tol-pal system protein YbgF